MPLSSDQMTVVRSWVGTTATDAELNERFTRLGTVTAAVEEQLRYDLSVLMEQPNRIALPSGLSIQTTENLKSMEERLRLFKNTGDLDGVDTAGGGIGRLHRSEKR